MNRTKLAVDGGPRAFDEAWPSWPSFDDAQVEAATNVLKSGRVNYWTGQEGRLFEREFADYVGVKHAVAVANGTVALELALYALGIGPGDEVIVPCRTFLATASSVAMRGATPVFADVDADSQNITAATIAPLISERTTAIIVVHLAGWPCDMPSIMGLARRHGLKVIEDCAQAHGAAIADKRVGAWGDAAAFSFCQDKIMTTGGEGGLVLTNDDAVWDRAWSYKDHGKSYNAVYNRPNTGLFRWLHESLGTNWRLTEMQSAIGRAQLKKLDEWVARRRENAAVLNEKLANVPGVRLTLPPSEAFHSYYKHYFFLDEKSLSLGWTRDRFLLALQAEGVPCGSGSCSEIYLEKAFTTSVNGNAGLAPRERRPVAQRIGEASVMLQVHHTLTTRQMRLASGAIEKVLAHAVANPVGSPIAGARERAA